MILLSIIASSGRKDTDQNRRCCHYFLKTRIKFRVHQCWTIGRPVIYYRKYQCWERWKVQVTTHSHKVDVSPHFQKQRLGHPIDGETEVPLVSTDWMVQSDLKHKKRAQRSAVSAIPWLSSQDRVGNSGRLFDLFVTFHAVWRSSSCFHMLTWGTQYQLQQFLVSWQGIGEQKDTEFTITYDRDPSDTCPSNRRNSNGDTSTPCADDIHEKIYNLSIEASRSANLFVSRRNQTFAAPCNNL